MRAHYPTCLFSLQYVWAAQRGGFAVEGRGVSVSADIQAGIAAV